MNTLTTARAQDVDEVLNPDCLPETNDDVNIFKQKQTFMHDVFDKTSQTDRGKKHLVEHEEESNTQSAHVKMNSFYNGSTNSRVSASTTFSHIKSANSKS